jgi:copper chaperone CopZ
MNNVCYSVPNISCDHCVMHIQKALQPLDGVKKVDVDIANKSITVEFDFPATDLQLRAVLIEIGYPAA